jgi:uncharacterized protein (TIGR02391 family)
MTLTGCRKILLTNTNTRPGQTGVERNVTYSKSELKKMFLRVLYECKYGTMQSYSWAVESIVPGWINRYFKISLTNDEKQICLQAVEELRTGGFLVKDATQMSDAFLVLTSEGKDLVEKQRDPDVHGIRLEQVVSDKELLSQCLAPFDDGNYEAAIFQAYKHIEERVRRAAEATEKDIGVDLITKALHPQNGKLLLAGCKLPAEQEGAYNLFKGAIQFFKNPSSHRTVNYENRNIAIEIIVLAELLLGILSTSQKRS